MPSLIKTGVFLKSSVTDIIQYTIYYNRYKKQVFYYILRMLSDRMLAEDLTQDVFLKLFEHFNSIRDKSRIKFWIYTTARNQVYQHIRKKKRAQPAELDESFPAPENVEEDYSEKEMKTIVRDTLELLPEDQKDVFVLKEYSGLSYQEIAELLAIDTSLVKSRLYKARQKMIVKIENLIT